MSFFRSQVLQLASSSLDGASRSTRTIAIDSVKEQLLVAATASNNDDDDDDDDDDSVDNSSSAIECRQALGVGGLALEASKRCSTPYAYKRLVNVVQFAITASLDNDNDTENNDGEDEDEEDDNLQALCQALCNLLVRSSDVYLLDEAASTFQTALSSCIKGRL